jgi:hypothetical protein
MNMTEQLIALFVLAMPVACIAWTVTHEEVFREARQWFSAKSRLSKHVYQRKFFYLFTCEYCFSHYAALLFLLLSGYKLLFSDWRGYLIGWLSLVWIANLYMSLFALLRLDIKRDRVEIAAVEKENRSVEVQGSSPPTAP